MSMLAFFPWLRIVNRVEIKNIILEPFVATEGNGNDSFTVCSKILSSYVDKNGQSIKEATLVTLKGQTSLKDYSEDEMEYLFSIADIISFSGLSKREYFNFGYFNSSDFMFIIQGFKNDLCGITVVSRKRDGQKLNYIPLDDYTVQVSDNVSHKIIDLDTNLISALLDAQDNLGDKWLEYADAIFSFNRANTDDVKVPESQEVIMVASSFQRILDAGHKEDELANKFLSVFDVGEDFDISTSGRMKKSKIKYGTLRELWVRDFYRLRNDFAHGHRKNKKQKIWDAREHLLLGAYIFPLILKLRLQNDKFYTLKDEDRFDINVFEALIDAELFKKLSVQGNFLDCKWNRIRKEKKSKMLAQKCLDYIQRKDNASEE